MTRFFSFLFSLLFILFQQSIGQSLFLALPDQGCGGVTTSFQTLYTSGGQPGFSYFWDFGNGLNSSLENPPAMNWSAPGTYPVILTVTVDTSGYYLDTVHVQAVSCTDPFGNAPDNYFKLFNQGGTEILNTYPGVPDQNSALFTFSWFNLLNETYSMEIWDEDGGFLNPDDYCGTVTFNGYTVGTQLLFDGNNQVRIVIRHDVLVFRDTAWITVFPEAISPTLVLLSPDTVCTGDSILLTSSISGNLSWFKLGETLPITTGDSLFVTESGSFFVEFTDANGCRAFSDTLTVWVFSYPAVPGWFFNGTALVTQATGTLQWFLNGDTIPGATGSQHIPTVSGDYLLAVANAAGCASFSPSFFVEAPIIDGILSPKAVDIGVTIFPNPAQQRVTIQISGGELKAVQLFNLLGKTILQQTGFPNGSVQTDLFLPNHLASGVYLLEIRTSKGMVREKLIIRD